MKVTAYKTVDVECEVDVDSDAIVNEFADRAMEASADYWRRVAPAIDCMTRILASIKDEVIQAMPEQARSILHERLTKEASRYKRP